MKVSVHQLLMEIKRQEALLLLFFYNFWDTQISTSTVWNSAKIEYYIPIIKEDIDMIYSAIVH